MRTRIISFHNGNLNPELVASQKKVFDKFELELEQIETTKPHPVAIDDFLKYNEWDTLVLFDIDCIPLHKYWVRNAISDVQGNHKIVAAAQKASHIPNSKIYASPCFMVITKKTFEHIGRPSFCATNRGDVAEEISYAAREHQVALYLLYPTKVENPLWPLTDEIKFGHGTTYGDAVYHAFESNANHHSTSRFIQKCQEVLAAPFVTF